MKNSRKIGAYLIGMLMLVFFVSLAGADSSNVTVTWIIPADESIQIQYPTGESDIRFNPGSKTFNDQVAVGQDDSTPGLNITNNGNTALQINFIFETALYDPGITFINCSIGDQTNSTNVTWNNSNASTTNHTVDASLAVDGTEEFWFWSCGTDMLESAAGEDTENLVVYYVDI